MNFDDHTKAFLCKAGQDTLKADTVFTSDTYCSAKFIFNNAALGNWDILVEYPDTTVMIKNGLTIEETQDGKFEIEILGSGQIRKNRESTYILRVTNTGNSTIVRPCINIAVECSDDKFQVFDNNITEVDKEIFKELGFDAREFSFMDSENVFGNPAKCKNGIFFLEDIPPYGSVDMTFNTKSDNNDLNISAWGSDYSIDGFADKAAIITYTDGQVHTYFGEADIEIKSSTIMKTCEDIMSDCYNNFMQDINNTLWENAQGEIKSQLLDLIPLKKAKEISIATYDLMEYYQDMSNCANDGICQADVYVNNKRDETKSAYLDYTKKTLTNWAYNKDLQNIFKDGPINAIALRNYSKKSLKYLSRAAKGSEIAGYLLSYGGVWALRAIQGNKMCNTNSLNPADCDKLSKLAKNGKNNPASLKVKAVGSFDPNDKYGYRSPSGSRYFNKDKTNFTYVIEFENKETATAAAQEVFVTDTLDSNVFDIESFKAGSIKIGNKRYEASTNARDAKWTIDMRPEMNYITYVTLKLDTATGVALWYFKSVDPLTLDWPTDPTAGFLPPNDSTGRGTGSVSFTIDLKKGISDEATLNNKATIVFDTNAPIVTPTWSNKKDIVAPTSSMFEPDIVGDNKALISWEGKDNKNGSGVYCYNLYVKKDNEAYTPLLQRSQLTFFDFEFEKDVDYSFYVTAIDSAENAEVKTNVPDLDFMQPSVTDLTAPVSHVAVMPSITQADSVLVKWSGTDEGTGLKEYTIFLSKNNSAFSKWLTTTSTEAWFKGEFGNTYGFYSIASDSAGNVEAEKSVADATTKLVDPVAEEELPIATITQKWDDVLICNNTENKFTNYQWFKNGTAISNANEQFYQETGGLNGSYYVQVTTTDGKIGVSNVIEVGGSTKSVKVYPNPSEESKEYNVEVTAEEPELTGGTLNVTNVNGQLISRRTGLQSQMKLNGLIRGVYLVQVRLSSGQSFNEKLIVK